MGKQVMTAAELEQMIHERLYRIEEIQEDMQANPRLLPKVATPSPHERDSHGRNWNATSMTTSAAPYKFWIIEIVDYLRWKYDIRQPS